MAFDCVGKSHVGLRRKVNEDSILLRSDRGYWAVADGMGGHDAGDVASAKVTEALRALPVVYDLDELVQAAIAAIARVNNELIALAASAEGQSTIGSTLVGLAIGKDEYRCFWAGDSRAYRIRAGQIEQLSRDHSLVQSLVDAGMLGPDEAEHHPNANVITRAVGVAQDLQVDVSSGDASPGDIFLVASDGLTRLVNDDEMLEILERFEPTEAADKLLEMVLVRGAPDNVSMVIVKMK